MSVIEAAENYVYGNHNDIAEAILKLPKGKAIAFTLDIMERLRGWYGGNEWLSFTAWVRTSKHFK